MRKIKFRAWNNADGRWLREDQFNIQPSGYVTAWEDDEEVKNEDVILMQFTGLKDKNDKEIWEGDIVRFVSTEGVVYIKEVKFNQESLSYCFGEMEYRVIDESAYFTESKHLEVIGNIWENPELLNKEAN